MRVLTRRTRLEISLVVALAVTGMVTALLAGVALGHRSTPVPGAKPTDLRLEASTTTAATLVYTPAKNTLYTSDQTFKLSVPQGAYLVTLSGWFDPTGHGECTVGNGDTTVLDADGTTGDQIGLLNGVGTTNVGTDDKMILSCTFSTSWSQNAGFPIRVLFTRVSRTAGKTTSVISVRHGR